MKLAQLITLNSLVFIGLGIAFAYAAPIMLAFFQVPQTLSGDVLDYWQVAAFARLFGAALFGFGFLLFSLRNAVDEFNPHSRRGVIFAMLLAHLAAAIVAVTQQFALWLNSAGWIATGIFGIFTLAYGYFLTPFGSQKR